MAVAVAAETAGRGGTSAWDGGRAPGDPSRGRARDARTWAPPPPARAEQRSGAAWRVHVVAPRVPWPGAPLHRVAR